MTRENVEVKHPNWRYDVFTDFTGGLALTRSGESIEDNQLLAADFMRLTDRRIESDYGVALDFAAPVMAGTPRLPIRFERLDGTVEALLLTDETLYQRLGFGNYYYASNGTSTTADDAMEGGETNLLVVSSAGFTVGERLGVVLDNDFQHRTTITAIPDATHITVADAIPIDRTVLQGAIVVEALNLAGTAAIQPSFVVLPSHDWIVFTNGVDPPHRYDGTTVVPVPNLPSSGNTVCRALGVFNNHLLLLNTTEGGVRKPRRVRNSDTGDPGNWSTGLAGFTDLLDEAGFVAAFAPLGPYGAVYLSDSIYLMEYVGTVAKLFNFRRAHVGDGVYSASSVTPVSNDEHAFAGRSGTYIFNGGTPQKISEPIESLIFAPFGAEALSFSALSNQMLLWHPRLQELWYAYTSNSASSLFPDKLLRYNLKYRAWTSRFPVNYAISGLGMWEIPTGTPWASAVGTWDDQTGQWGIAGAASFPLIAISADGIGIGLVDFKSTKDFTTDNTAWEVRTRETFHPLAKVRLDFVDVSFEGSVFDQFVSVYAESPEYGSFLLGTKEVDVSGAETVFRATQQLVMRRFHIRVTGTAPGVRINYIGYKYIVESEV